MARHGTIYLLTKQLKTPEHLMVEQYNICNPLVWLVQKKFIDSIKLQVILYPRQLKLLLNNYEFSWTNDTDFCFTQQIKPNIMSASIITRLNHEANVNIKYNGKFFRVLYPTISCVHEKYRISLRATIKPAHIEISCPPINLPYDMIDAPNVIKRIIRDTNKNYKTKNYPLDKLGGPGLSMLQWAEILFGVLSEEIDSWFV